MVESTPFESLIRWTADGLVAAIVQDAGNGEVLMMAWMDRAALARTIASGESHFYSRSRQSAWHKGGTSGHVQKVREIRVDCDGDVLLLRVDQAGGACHEGFRSCFFRTLDGARGTVVQNAERVFTPDDVYTAKA